MTVEYKLNSEDIVRVLAAYFEVNTEDVDINIREYETGWEMAPILKREVNATVKVNN